MSSLLSLKSKLIKKEDREIIEEISQTELGTKKREHILMENRDAADKIKTYIIGLLTSMAHKLGMKSGDDSSPLSLAPKKP